MLSVRAAYPTDPFALTTAKCDDRRVDGQGEALLDAARKSLAGCEFSAACDMYETALTSGPSAEALDGLGQALWFLCEIEAGIARREEAYAAYRREGHLGKAAEIALWLVVEHATSLGNETVANGWFARAERLLAEAPLCAAHAQLEVHRGQLCGAPEQAASHFKRAVAIGRELGDLNSEVRGLSQLGFLKVSLGDLEEGMRLLDESMAAAVGGELTDPWAIGATCCSMLFACDRVADLRRAEEWCRYVGDVTRTHRFVPLSALCRSVYAGVLIASGQWEAAESELLTAVETYRGVGRPLAAYPLARLAALRARQGRLEEAEQLVAGWEGHPEMGAVTVLLHLERGQTTLAAARLDQQLRRAPLDSPSAVPLLPLLARLRLAEGDMPAADEAAKVYQDLAARLGHPHLLASSQVVRAQVDAALRRDAAVPLLESAIGLFLRLRMPYDEAIARLELATVVAANQPELAISEARTGVGIFARLGAARGADRAAELLRSLGARGPGAPHAHDDLTQREREVLGAARARPDKPRDRRAAVHRTEDRRPPRQPDPVEAGSCDHAPRQPRSQFGSASNGPVDRSVDR